jgi:hypothetical protein
MRENRTSGSEGRESETNRTSLPLSAQELEHRQRHLPVALFSPRASARTATIRERHLSCLQGEDAVISNRRAEDIPAQVFERRHTITDRLHIADELAAEFPRCREFGRSELRTQQSFELPAEQFR